MSTLLEKLPLPDKREEIVNECVVLLDSEVKKKKGMSGLAVKAGYKVLKSFKPGAVYEVVNGLLDDFIVALEPYHAKYCDSATQPTFGTYLTDHSQDVADALVKVTDQRAENSKHKALARGYFKLRPTAVRNVSDGVPGLASILDKHYMK